jgi:hypothetical protein
MIEHLPQTMRPWVQTLVLIKKKKKKMARKPSIFENQILCFEISISQRNIYKGNDNIFVTNLHIVTNGFLEDYRDHKILTNSSLCGRNVSLETCQDSLTWLANKT